MKQFRFQHGAGGCQYTLAHAVRVIAVASTCITRTALLLIFFISNFIEPSLVGRPQVLPCQGVKLMSLS